VPERDRGAYSRPPAAVEAGPQGLRLVVDGAVQSVQVGETEPAGYWPALIPTHRPRTALLLGLGGGTAAHLLLRRWGHVTITGVDDDPEVLRLGRLRFGLDRVPLTTVEADARTYVRACRDHFDLVIVAVYRGEQAPEFLASHSFVRAVRQLVAPGGTAVWNLQRDRRGSRLRRLIGRGMLPERRALAGLNLVLHFRRRSRVLRNSLPVR
jgi:spermidine synthase